MDYNRFYERLFAPLEAALDRRLDDETLIAIVGFDEGGPVNLCTVGRGVPGDGVVYVTCELCVRDAQVPNRSGRYELLIECNDEVWARSVLTEVAGMTLATAFNDTDTLDIGAWVDGDETLQGLLFREEYALRIDHRAVGVLRCIGVTRGEMDLARLRGPEALRAKLQAAGVGLRTRPGRAPVV